MRNTRITVLVEIGLSIALAAVLNLTKVFEMPQGGSVSLAMLPLFVLALRRGLPAGVAAGVLYGVLDVLLQPFVVHWVQFFLDYPIAYGAVGLTGLFAGAWHRSVTANRLGRAILIALVPAVLVGTIGRYLAHVASGVIFFSEYAEGQPVLAYSAIYNLYVPVSAAACLAAAILLMPVLERAVPSVNSTRE